MKNIKEYLLDSRMGTLIWLLQFKLGDRRAVYPVQFLGFLGKQLAGTTIIVTNPWTDGYCDLIQDDKCMFRTAAHVIEVSMYDVHPCPESAFRSLINGMQYSGLGRQAIANFLKIEVELLSDEQIVEKATKMLMQELHSESYRHHFLEIGGKDL